MNTYLAYPQPVDCLAGTPCLERGGLDEPHPYWETKMNEMERMNVTAPDGTHVLMGDSFTNYIVPAMVSAYCINVGCYGINLRHLIQQLPRTPTLRRAGLVVIYGLIVNSIDAEVRGGRTEAQMLANIDYMLEGLAGWFTGNGVFVACTPVIDPYLPCPWLTNSNINAANAYLQNRFGSKAGWMVVNVNSTLAPAGQLLSQYSETKPDGSPQGCHLSKAGIDVVFSAVRQAL